jgi:hypothetical protein
MLNDEVSHYVFATISIIYNNLTCIACIHILFPLEVSLFYYISRLSIPRISSFSHTNLLEVTISVFFFFFFLYLFTYFFLILKPIILPYSIYKLYAISSDSNCMHFDDLNFIGIFGNKIFHQDIHILLSLKEITLPTKNINSNCSLIIMFTDIYSNNILHQKSNLKVSNFNQ